MADSPLPTSPEPVQPVPPALPAPETKAEEPEKKSSVWLIIGVVVLLLVMIGLVIFLFSQDVSTTSKIRDVFLIFLALQTFVIGTVLIILVVQISLLINLVRNEIKPVIESTDKTVKTLRGTATFLSDNLSSPVIKANTFFAATRKFFQLLFPKAKGK